MPRPPYFFQKRARTHDAVSPAVTDSTDASHTAGKISKAFSAPSAARTPATVAGMS